MWTSNDLASEASLGQDIGAEPFVDVDAALLVGMMDEIDHGILVINDRCQLRHANQLALHALATSRFIACHGQTLKGRSPQFTQQIELAVRHAVNGHRQLVSFKEAQLELTLAFVPLRRAQVTDAPSLLVLLSRQNVGENLALHLYARAHQVSPSEELVLIALCKGFSIPEIAQAHHVAPSTVRTQVKALRHKTGCSSIRSIMLLVNSLPPMVSALRVGVRNDELRLRTCLGDGAIG